MGDGAVVIDDTKGDDDDRSTVMTMVVRMMTMRMAMVELMMVKTLLALWR